LALPDLVYENHDSRLKNGVTYASGLTVTWSYSLACVFIGNICVETRNRNHSSWTLNETLLVGNARHHETMMQRLNMLSMVYPREAHRRFIRYAQPSSFKKSPPAQKASEAYSEVKSTSSSRLTVRNRSADRCVTGNN
jgi:hypothetical protein